MISISSVYNFLPEKGKNLVSAIGHGAMAGLTAYALKMAYELEVCKWYGRFPLCLNHPIMTFATHTAAIGTIDYCATTALEELTQFFR